ncbi:MAG: MoaD/ThiS family protein [Fimbriiglobus sp.]|nr:MoaD/ThiS family protein [Fimbriiglobus sp.]
MEPSGTLTVRLFAAAAERVGSPAVVVPCPPTVAELRRTLADTWVSLADLLPRCAIAVNHEYAANDTPLSSGDEVAVIPPVSGG